MSANEHFKQLLKLISANYDRQLTEQQLELFKTMAKQFGFDAFQKAVMAHMQDPDVGMYFPNMAHIAGKITGTKKENHSELEGQAQMQWMTVMRAIRQCGSYRTPKFKDPVTAATVIALGGWPEICALSTDKLEWKGKEFVNTYQEFTNRPLDQLPSHIAGLEDLQQAKSESAGILAHLNDKFDEQFGGNQ